MKGDTECGGSVSKSLLIRTTWMIPMGGTDIVAFGTVLGGSNAGEYPATIGSKPPLPSSLRFASAGISGEIQQQSMSALISPFVALELGSETGRTTMSFRIPVEDLL